MPQFTNGRENPGSFDPSPGGGVVILFIWGITLLPFFIAVIVDWLS